MHEKDGIQMFLSQRNVPIAQSVQFAIQGAQFFELTAHRMSANYFKPFVISSQKD